MRELRCPGNILHGLLVTSGEGIIEFRCRSKFCGKAPGVVVLHRFDLGTGELTSRSYLEPNLNERNAYGSGQSGASVRSA